MTPLHEPGPEDQLVSYLLGLLPDEEAERLDELNIADEEFAWQLRVVEDDLIDAYVTGALAGDTLDRFESFYLASEHRRRKVKFARSLRRVVDRGVGTAGAGAGSNHIRPPGSERNRASSAGSPANQSVPPRVGWVWKLAAAAALVLLAGGALYEDIRLRGALNDARGASAALSNQARDLERQLSDQRVVNDSVLNELEKVRLPQAGNGSASAPPRSPEPAGGTPRALPAVALVLLPQTRGAGPIATLAVPQGLDRVALDLRLEPGDFSRYEVALKDPAGSHIVWRSGRITSSTIDDTPTISLLIPSTVLKTQYYSLELNGITAAGTADVIGSYVFQVVRR